MTFEIVRPRELSAAPTYPATVDWVLVLLVHVSLVPFLVLRAFEALAAARIATREFVLSNHRFTGKAGSDSCCFRSTGWTKMALAFIATSMETVNTWSMFRELQSIDVMLCKLIFGVIDIML